MTWGPRTQLVLRLELIAPGIAQNARPDPGCRESWAAPEFDSVTLVLPEYEVPVLTRELFYTGLTRGRARLVVYADPNVLARTIKRRVTRVSGLAARLSGRDNAQRRT